MYQGPQYQMIVPLTKAVKRLLIANVAVWILLVLIVEKFFMSQPYISEWFGLVPAAVFSKGWVWQLFTYMFLHSSNVFHILFNMLMLWWLGAELEQRWGYRWFLFFYGFSGVGAGIIYLFGVSIYYVLTNDLLPLQVPVVGASGSIFGLLLAYGILFGERPIYFMMLFPMKARYFVMILGGIEIVSLLNSGFASGVANLAHLGGIASGFVALIIMARWKGQKSRPNPKKHGRKLKLVVDNERQFNNDPKGPKYWN